MHYPFERKIVPEIIAGLKRKITAFQLIRELLGGLADNLNISDNRILGFFVGKKILVGEPVCIPPDFPQADDDVSQQVAILLPGPPAG